MMMKNIQELDDPKKCEALMDAYKMRDYYAKMLEVADHKIERLISDMKWSDIKYCIERTSK